MSCAQETGETTWDKPPGVGSSAGDSSGATPSINSEWDIMVDAESANKYYVNKVSEDVLGVAALLMSGSRCSLQVRAHGKNRRGGGTRTWVAMRNRHEHVRHWCVDRSGM